MANEPYLKWNFGVIRHPKVMVLKRRKWKLLELLETASRLCKPGLLYGLSDDEIASDINLSPEAWLEFRDELLERGHLTVAFYEKQRAYVFAFWVLQDQGYERKDGPAVVDPRRGLLPLPTEEAVKQIVLSPRAAQELQESREQKIQSTARVYFNRFNHEDGTKNRFGFVGPDLQPETPEYEALREEWMTRYLVALDSGLGPAAASRSVMASYASPAPSAPSEPAAATPEDAPVTPPVSKNPVPESPVCNAFFGEGSKGDSTVTELSNAPQYIEQLEKQSGEEASSNKGGAGTDGVTENCNTSPTADEKAAAAALLSVTGIALQTGEKVTIAPDVAELFVNKYPLDQIRLQCEMLPYRDAPPAGKGTWAGKLRTAIEQNWEAPARYQEHLQTEQAKREREQARAREQEKQAAAQAEREAEKAMLGSWEAGLTVAERDGIEIETLALLKDKNPAAWRGYTEGKKSPVVMSAYEPIRRDVLKRWFAVWEKEQQRDAA